MYKTLDLINLKYKHVKTIQTTFSSSIISKVINRVAKGLTYSNQLSEKLYHSL